MVRNNSLFANFFFFCPWKNTSKKERKVAFGSIKFNIVAIVVLFKWVPFISMTHFRILKIVPFINRKSVMQNIKFILPKRIILSIITLIYIWFYRIENGICLTNANRTNRFKVVNLETFIYAPRKKVKKKNGNNVSKRAYRANRANRIELNWWFIIIIAVI